MLWVLFEKKANLYLFLIVSTLTLFLILNFAVTLPRNFKPTTKASSGWSFTNSLAWERVFHTATVLSDRKVIVIGGASRDYAALVTDELYDIPTGSWHLGFSYISRTFHTSSMLLDGNLLITGGSEDDGGHGIPYTQLYDPIADNWTQVEDMLDSRGAHTASVLANGKVLVAGGVGDGFSLVDTCELYDPSNRTWSRISSMHYARALHTAAVLQNGKVLVTGGLAVYPNGKVLVTGDEVLNVTEVYDPLTGNWTKADSMHAERYFHTATLLNNGQVLVTGGTNDLEPAIASCELYNPSTDTWTITGSMYEERREHTASLLPNGKVLVAGGVNNSDIAVNTIELYDPTTGNWTKAENMLLGLAGHTASVLKNGNVLISGGVSGTSRNTDISKIAMLYNSSTEAFTTVAQNSHINK